MSNSYDILIRNAHIVDGTGKPGFSGSLGIRGERIAAIGDLSGTAAQTIDAEGLIASPGFVDPHSHADMSILQHPQAENLVMQGITTFVGGNCGFSQAPVTGDIVADPWGRETSPTWRTFGEWLARVEGRGLSLNCVPLVGHEAVRRAVMGEDFRRQATTAEIEHMKTLVDEGMRSGARGFTVGLDAFHVGHFAGVDELIALVKVAQSYDGLFAPHTRHHQNQWPADNPNEYAYGIFHSPRGETFAGRYHGLIEAVEIARLANRIQLHIAHLTPAYLIPQPHPAFLDEAVARATLQDIIDRPRDEGLDVSFNVLGWESSIGAEIPMSESFFSKRLALPDWLRALDQAGFVKQLKMRSFRDKVRDFVYSGKFKFDMVHPVTDPYWIDCYVILRHKNPAYVGKTIGDLARGRQPFHTIDAVYVESLEAYFDLLVEDPAATWGQAIDKREYGVASTFFQHSMSMPCTDVLAFPPVPPQRFNVPPIAYGMFPHFFRVYIKEQHLMSLEDAVKKVTSVPAQQVFKLKDRGVLREGAYADIVLFDFERLRETNDFLSPASPPEGISAVLVNGATVYREGAHTGALPGKVLRHN